jgi:hypothetical protein
MLSHTLPDGGHDLPETVATTITHMQVNAGGVVTLGNLRIFTLDERWSA